MAQFLQSNFSFVIIKNFYCKNHNLLVLTTYLYSHAKFSRYRSKILLSQLNYAIGNHCGTHNRSCFLCKFRFCGDGDCPDWVLGEIISTLSVLEANKLKALADLVAKKILGQEFDETEVRSLTSSVSSDGKTAVACIHFLLNNAARHNASEIVFNEEIQQLGLPKEHAEAMCSVLALHAPTIRQRLIDKSFKINELSSIQHLPSAVDSINCSRFELQISQELVDGLPQNTTHVINVENAQLKVLLEELKYARDVMEKYNNKDLNNV